MGLTFLANTFLSRLSWYFWDTRQGEFVFYYLKLDTCTQSTSVQLSILIKIKKYIYLDKFFRVKCIYEAWMYITFKCSQNKSTSVLVYIFHYNTTIFSFTIHLSINILVILHSVCMNLKTTIRRITVQTYKLNLQYGGMPKQNID